MSPGFKAEYFVGLAEVEAGNFWFRARNKIILWAIKQYYPNFRSFLEIGCGTGYVLAGIAEEFPRAQLCGSEYLAEGLEFAKRRIPDAQFMQLDAREMPFEQKFDAIGAFDVIEHIDEDDAVLKGVFKALVPGGMVFITVPQHRWLWSAADEYACHVRRYGPGELDEKLRTAGFKLIRTSSFVTTLLPLMFLNRILRKSIDEIRQDPLSELRLNPVLNRVFEWLLNIELALIRLGVNFPVGGSRLYIAQK